MKKQYKKIAFITIVLLLISTKLKGVKMFTLNNWKDPNKTRMFQIIEALTKLGLNKKQIKFCLSQIMLETGNFKSANKGVAKLNNNYSGIKYICKPYQKASKGSLVPANERKAPANRCGNYYAYFNNIGEWAADYVRILNLKTKPINSDTIEEFHKKITENHYYDTSNPAKVAQYLKNLQWFYANID